MSFLKFIIKNPFRRKNSAILSIVGICIGIIVIVALGGITNGLVSTFEDTIHEVPTFQFRERKLGIPHMVPIRLMPIGLIRLRMSAVLRKRILFMLF